MSIFNSKTRTRDVLKGKDLKGKVAIVTGANSGIGTETVKALASAGCRVILASRLKSNGEAAVENEIKREGHFLRKGDEPYTLDDVSNIVVKELKLDDMASIKVFADDVIATEERIDFLILNAGLMVPQLEHTKQGFEMQIGVNHFGHTYLYNLLEGKMLKQPFNSRVVVVSSGAYMAASKLNLQDLHFKSRAYSGFGSYSQSKLANLLFAKGMAVKMKDSNISYYSLHPGMIYTSIFRHSSPSACIKNMILCVSKTMQQGAATTVYCCVGEGIPNGSFLSDCKVEPLKGQAKDINCVLSLPLIEETNKQLEEAVHKGITTTI